jgi:hypothetical protein
MKEGARRKRRSWPVRTQMFSKTILNHVKHFRWQSTIKAHLPPLETCE